MLIKNGTIHDAVNALPYQADIALRDGVIAAIGPGLQPLDGEEVLDAAGKQVYPGFVDAHSHLGLDNYGMGWEGHDYNEMGDVLACQLRGIDSFNPRDTAIPAALRGGVTTVGTGPGSANVLGGTFLAVKTYGSCVDDMVIQAEVAMKCAFGENPKRCYKEKGNSARMTTAAKLREMLFQARDYGERKAAAGDDPLKRPKFDMKMEALLPVLRGEIPLKAHAHRADDICTAIRIAREFGGPHADPRQQDRAGQQDLRDPRHPGPGRLAGQHHYRFAGNPPAVPAPVRGPGGQGGHGPLCRPPGHHHQPRQASGRGGPGGLPGAGQGRGRGGRQWGPHGQRHRH